MTKLSSNSNVLKNTINLLVTLKLSFVFLALFAPLSHPHIIRQADSLGISIRYWLRWTIESDLAYPLLPALIQAGDKYGIHATEFPILYIITAPFHALPNPYNLILARLFLVGLSLALLYISYRVWEKTELLEGSSEYIHKLMLVFGVSSVFFWRFMPDFIAFILVSISVALCFIRKTYLLSFILASFGMLIKPTAVLAFAPLLLKPNKKDVLKNIFYWVLPAFLVTLTYYTIGTNYLNSVSDIDKYFYSNFRNPFIQLGDFFLEPLSIIKLFFKDVFSSFLLVFLIYSAFKNKANKRLWCLLGLQILGGAALDGEHSFIHYYYFISTSFIVSWLGIDFLQSEKNKRLTIMFLVILGLHTLDKGIYSVKKSFDTDSLMWQCAEISKLIPKHIYKIRNKITRYSKIGTCVGKIQNSKTSEYGVYPRDYKINERFDEIHTTKNLKLVRFK